MNKMVFFLLIIVSTFSANAQEYAAVLGVHQTEAEPRGTISGTSDAKMNFKVGVLASFELMGHTHFRTGLLYNQRHFEIDNPTTGAETKVNFDYIDIPANVQWHLNERIGFFGGLIIGVNTNEKIKYSASANPMPAADSEKMIPLLNAGVSLLFEDMIGFDFYLERGIGEIANNFENYKTFGANFLFWF